MDAFFHGFYQQSTLTLEFMDHWIIENKLVLIAEKDLKLGTNMEYKSKCVISGNPIVVRYAGADFGYVATKNVVRADDWIVTDRGIALKSMGPVRIQYGITLAPAHFFWSKVKMLNMGAWADDVKATDVMLNNLAKMYPELVAHSLEDLVYNHVHKYEFKRRRKPLVRFLSLDGCIYTTVMWELYLEDPGAPRLGAYVGVDNNGLGGYIGFFDKPKPI